MHSIEENCREADIIALTGNFLNDEADCAKQFPLADQMLCMGQFLQEIANIPNGPSIIATSGWEDLEDLSLSQDFDLDKFIAYSGISYEHSKGHGWIRHFLSGHAFKAPTVCHSSATLLRFGQTSAVFYCPIWTPRHERGLKFEENLRSNLREGRKLADEHNCSFIVLTNEPPFSCETTDFILHSIPGPDYWLCGQVSDFSSVGNAHNPFAGLPYYMIGDTVVLTAGYSDTRDACYIDLKIGGNKITHFNGYSTMPYCIDGTLQFSGESL